MYASPNKRGVSYLDTLVLQLIAIFEGHRVDTNTLIDTFINDKRSMRLLGANPSGLHQVLRDCNMWSTRSLEFDSPPFG